MADRGVTITISAKDNFSTVLSKYEKAVKGAGDETEKAGNKSKKTGGQVQKMSTDMKNSIAAIGVAGVIKIGSELNELGVQANRAREVFNELTTDIGGAENVLAGLQDTTGGVVDNITLMESANKLLLSGLAENDVELNEMISLATKLGAAMGEDAGKSIENFSLTLLNNSIPRLDSFGISGANVRARINELLESGQALNRDEAFKLAVFEEGRIAIEKLGDSANVSTTELAELETQVENTIQAFAGRLAEGVEGTAGIINVAGEEDFVGALVTAVASEITGQRIESIDQAPSVTGEDRASTREERQARDAAAIEAMKQGTQAIEEQNDARKRAVDSGLFQYNQMLSDTIESQERATQAVKDQDLAHQRAATSGLFQYNQMLGDTIESQERAAQAVKDQDLAHQRAATSGLFQYNQMLGDTIESQERAAQAIQDQTLIADAFAGFDVGANAFQGVFDTLSQTTISGTDITFFDPDEVARLNAALDDVNANVAELEMLNEQGLISDEELQKARDLADQFGIMASDAETLARSIEDLSLSELFGQQDGGQLGEAGNIIQGFIEDVDIAQAFADSIGLASGAETEISQAFDNTIAPILAQVAIEQGADAATAYLEAYLEAIRTGQGVGLDAGGITQAGEGAIPFQLDEDGNLVPVSIFPQPEGGTQAFEEGDGFLEGFSTLTEIIEEAQLAAENLSNTQVEVDTTEAEIAVSDLDALLVTLSETEFVVDVSLNVDTSDLVKLGLTPTGTNVRDNGGSVKGEDPRTRTRPRD